MAKQASKGKVYLVGAGPGAPDLLTLRGAKLIEEADAVIYDRLVNPELLEQTKAKCEHVYVGKRSGDHGKKQKQINQILVEKAKQHKTVVRLKGGDPTVFGRITEELDALNKAGIAFEVVPGVSSVWAAAAAAGIPLTDRELSSSVVIATGQEARQASRYEGGHRPVQWSALSQSADTLVILMGRLNLPSIVEQLLEHRPKTTPIALIRWASMPEQDILISTLGKVEEALAQRQDFWPPVVAVVGDVVKHSKRFGANLLNTVKQRPVTQQPLEGKTVLVTRPEQDATRLTQKFEQLGAKCVCLPTVKVVAKRFTPQNRKALLKSLGTYDWILFASHHGVDQLHRLSVLEKKALPDLVRAKICGVGPTTVRSILATGLAPDLVPETFSKEGIKQAFKKISLKGKRVLIPRSARALGDDLSAWLSEQGAQVDEVAMYNTKSNVIPAQTLKQALKADVLTFTSASTAQSFLESVQQAHPKRKPNQVLQKRHCVAIGPSTREVLEAAQVASVMPKKNWTLDGMVDACLEVLQ